MKDERLTGEREERGKMKNEYMGVRGSEREGERWKVLT